MKSKWVPLHVNTPVLNCHSEFQDAVVVHTDYHLHSLGILLMTNTFIHIVAMGNLLSHRCVPVRCFHVFDSRCLQTAPVRQSREHGVPRFLANRLRGQSSDLSLTNGQCGTVILSHGFEINRCFDPPSVQIAGQQGTGWSMDFTWMWRSLKLG